MSDKSWFSPLLFFGVFRIIHRVILLTTKWHIVGLLCVHNSKRFGRSKPTIISPTEFQTSSCTYNHITFLPALDIQMLVVTVCGWFSFDIVLCSVSCKVRLQFLTAGIWNFRYPMEYFMSWIFYIWIHVQYTTIYKVTIVTQSPYIVSFVTFGLLGYSFLHTPRLL